MDTSKNTDINIVKYKGWKLDRIMVFRVGNKLPYLSVGITFERGDIKESVIINFNYSSINIRLKIRDLFFFKFFVSFFELIKINIFKKDAYTVSISKI